MADENKPAENITPPPVAPEVPKTRDDWAKLETTIRRVGKS